MITQYDAVAEIEAMKFARRRAQKAAAISEALPAVGWGASENDVRAEMERRLARRAAKQSAPANDDAS